VAISLSRSVVLILNNGGALLEELRFLEHRGTRQKNIEYCKSQNIHMSFNFVFFTTGEIRGIQGPRKNKNLIEITRGELSDCTICFLTPPLLGEKLHFLNFSQKTSVLELRLSCITL
jgi:hypothetical protein